MRVPHPQLVLTALGDVTGLASELLRVGLLTLFVLERTIGMTGQLLVQELSQLLLFYVLVEVHAVIVGGLPFVQLFLLRFRRLLTLNIDLVAAQGFRCQIALH